jgi:hypothetical protein
MQFPKYVETTSFSAQRQYYKCNISPPNLPPEVDRAIARGSYTSRMSLMVDRAIVATELRYELEFGGLNDA